jgi:CsoR family transcriptional regulator, copper-sensing transcriptional repressor
MCSVKNMGGNMAEKCDVCDVQHAHHSEDFKKSLKNRMNRIEGQIRGINRMIQEDVYCDDILNQIAAVQSALVAAGEVLLDAHIKSCIVENIQAGKLAAVDELMLTIKKLIR